MNIPACSNRERHFTRDDEEDLRKEPTTSSILDTARNNAGVGGPRLEVRGDDKTWRETKEEQQVHVGIGGLLSFGHGAVEAVHLAEFHAVESFTAAGLGAGVGAGLVIGGAVGGLALGIHEWLEAHKKGDEQRAALGKDELHVAMLTQLDLPQGYKAAQLAARPQAGQGFQSAAMKTATSLSIDKPLVAVMQHHADLGMRAARDFLESGASKEKFLSANPAVADAYKKDPAFHDGFDALVWAKDQKAAPGLYKETIDKADSRDCRYAQQNVSYKL